jgi:hypothetical protein
MAPKAAAAKGKSGPSEHASYQGQRAPPPPAPRRIPTARLFPGRATVVQIVVAVDF